MLCQPAIERLRLNGHNVMTRIVDGLPKRRNYPTDMLPSAQQIAAAKQDLREDKVHLQRLRKLEEAAKAELDEKEKEINERINMYHAERDVVRANQSAALSYVAPIRRLPLEIFREIFLVANSFERYGRTPWQVSGTLYFHSRLSRPKATIPAVCRLWRKMALSMCAFLWFMYLSL